VWMHGDRRSEPACLAVEWVHFVGEGGNGKSGGRLGPADRADIASGAVDGDVEVGLGRCSRWEGVLVRRDGSPILPNPTIPIRYISTSLCPSDVAGGYSEPFVGARAQGQLHRDRALVDPPTEHFEGAQTLANKGIRCCGVPSVRFGLTPQDRDARSWTHAWASTNGPDMTSSPGCSSWSSQDK
jgi:hypothetical protein